MQSGKVLIMPIRPQPSVPESVPPEGEGPVFGPGPISASDIRTLYTVLDIKKTLGGMEHAVEVLESTTKSHGEKLNEIDRIQYALSILEHSNVLHGQNLDQLGKDVYAGKILGGIIVAAGGLTALVIYVVHRLAPFFAK